MAVLCQLADPEGYRVSTWNLASKPEVASYWLNLFASFSNRFDKHLIDDGLAGDGFHKVWPAFQTEYNDRLCRIREAAKESGSLYTIDLCRFRQEMLNKYGFHDPYLGVKRKENDLAASLYPQVIARIDNARADDRWPMLWRGILAGNMFDLGSPETITMYHRGGIDFFAIFDRVPPRPWFIDHVDIIEHRLRRGPAWRQVLFFVDNAGADIVLGVLPLAREMARMGICTVLAPNTFPALNDITLDELDPLLSRLAEADPLLRDILADRLLTTVGSGGDTPLIDLGRISDECNSIAAESDLIVLEGMGRGVESNWTERFKCDVARIALLKDRTVVDWVGAKLFDGICRFDKND